VTALHNDLAGYPVLQPGSFTDGPYLDSNPDNVFWGRLPCQEDTPRAAVAPGEVITVDTLSHEGILEDQGKDPVEFFGRYDVRAADVLADARAVAASDLAHDFVEDGPHVVTGPIAVRGAKPGDLLAITVLDLTPRVGYGMVSARHGFGALPGEMPMPGVTEPVTTFATATPGPGAGVGEMLVDRDDRSRGRITFPLAPFLGVMGVATAGAERLHSVPPGVWGGNVDVNLLGVGSTLYLPVQVDDAMAYFGDPHFVQGDGEVALTAFEASLRATLRLDVIPGGAALRPGTGPAAFAETEDLLIPLGMDEDLNEAMKKCVRCALDLLATDYGLERHLAMAYLSAAGDFAVSQVVDVVKGIHGKIRKADLREVTR